MTITAKARIQSRVNATEIVNAVKRRKKKRTTMPKIRWYLSELLDFLGIAVCLAGCGIFFVAVITYDVVRDMCRQVKNAYE
jgi:hypothetical protein